MAACGLSGVAAVLMRAARLAAVVLGLDACRELLCNAHEVDAANRAQA